MDRSCNWPPYRGSSTGPFAPGTLRRRSNPRSGSSGWSGGFPLPSWLWQEEHDKALWVGPRPSRASVLAGAVTQFWLKKLSPTSKIRLMSFGRFRADNSKAFVPTLNAVVSPPSRVLYTTLKSTSSSSLHAPIIRTTTASRRLPANGRHRFSAF